MMVSPKPVAFKGMMLMPDQRDMYEMYAEMYAPMLEITRKHGAILDLTTSQCVVLMNTTRRCRQAIKREYGLFSQADRIGKTMVLRGFNSCQE